MSDYILDTKSIRLTSSTFMDNFIFREGELEVSPSALVTYSGFYFSPTDSYDPIGKIHRAIKSKLSLHAGLNDTFEKFYIYDEFKPNEPLFFPCLLIISDEPSVTSSAFFGGEYMEKTDVKIEVAFKKDKMLKTVDGTLSGLSLAEYYLFETRNLLDEINYDSDVIKIGDVSFENVVHEPVEANQTLYGFEMKMTIEFKVEE